MQIELKSSGVYLASYRPGGVGSVSLAYRNEMGILADAILIFAAF